MTPEQILASDDYFDCERFSCRMLKSACIARLQEVEKGPRFNGSNGCEGCTQKRLCSICGERHADLQNGHCGICHAEIMRKAKGEKKKLTEPAERREKKPVEVAKKEQKKPKCRTIDCKNEANHNNGLCTECNSTLSNEGRKTLRHINFKGYEDVLESLEKSAKEQVRTVEQQMIFLIRQGLRME